MRTALLITLVCFFRSSLADSVACGSNRPRVLNSTRATFTSPNYPANYPNNQNCHWLIQPGGINVIDLTFNTFRTEASYDFINVYDGDSESAPRILRYAGSSVPADIRSTGNSLYVVFTTDSSVTYQGFSISYSQPDPLENEACGDFRPANINVSPGEVDYLSSPRYDGSGDYPPNLLCAVTFVTPPNYVLSVNFVDFELEEPDEFPRGCRFDSLSLYNNETLINSYCGTDGPPPTISLGRYFSAVFSTDESIQRRGFNFTFEAVLESGVTRPSTTPTTTTIRTSPGVTGLPPTSPPVRDLQLLVRFDGIFNPQDGEADLTPCLATYGNEFRKNLVTFMTGVNALLANGTMCGPNFRNAQIMNVQTSIIKPPGVNNQALAQAGVSISALENVPFIEQLNCAQSVTDFSVILSHWPNRNPISDAGPGCPAVTFPQDMSAVDPNYLCEPLFGANVVAL